MPNNNNPLGIQENADNCTTGGLSQSSTLSAEPIDPGGCCVESVNGKKGVVVLTTDDVADSVTNPYSTPARVRAALSGTTPINFNGLTGAISHAVSGIAAGSYSTEGKFMVVTVNETGHVTAISLEDLPDAGSIGPDLTAIEALVGTGYLIRTATNTWALKSVAGSAGRIIVTNGDGVAGPSTFDLATVDDALVGTYGSSTQVPRITLDKYGRVISVSLQTISAGGVFDMPSIGELLNVAPTADAAANGSTLIYNTGTAKWEPGSIAFPTFPTDTVTMEGAFAVARDAVNNEPINEVAAISDALGGNMVSLHLAAYILFDDLTPLTSLTVPLPYLVNKQIGTMPVGYFPSTTVQIPLTTTYADGTLKTYGSSLIIGTQKIDKCNLRIAPDGKIYVTAFIDVADFVFPTSTLDFEALFVIEVATTFFTKTPPL